MCVLMRDSLKFLRQADIRNHISSPYAWYPQVSTSPSTHNYSTSQTKISNWKSVIDRMAKMFHPPTNSIENAMTPCFFNVRQVLPTNLHTQAVLQLPPRHGGIQFIEDIQPILHHLLEVYTHITNFIKAGNNNNPTWTPADKCWHYMEEYENVWARIEDLLNKCLLIASNGDADLAKRNGAHFMKNEVNQCGCGFDFFKALCTNAAYPDTAGFFNDIEAFCERIEEECSLART